MSYFGGIKMTPNDKLWSLIVRTRAGWRCECCKEDFSSNRAGLAGAHIHTVWYMGEPTPVAARGKWSLRNDPEVGIALCNNDCHDKYDGKQGFTKQHHMVLWVTKYLGEKRIEKLVSMKNRVTPGVKGKASQSLIYFYLTRELEKLTK